MPKTFSAEASDLVIKLLNQDPSSRFRINDVLEHPFISPKSKPVNIYKKSSDEKKEKATPPRLQMSNMLETSETKGH